MSKVQGMTEFGGKRYRAFLGSLGLLNFAGVCAQIVMIPLLTEIAEEFSVREGGAAIVVAGFGLPGIITPILVGPATDRYGRKTFLVGGMLLVAGGTLLSAAASTFDVLVLSRVIAGVGAWLVFPSAYAAIADSLPYYKRGRALSTNMGFGTLASIAWIPIAGIIAESTSWRASVGLTGIISLISAGMLFYFVPSFKIEREIHHARELFGSILTNGSVVAAYTSSFLGSSSWFIWSPFVVVFFKLKYMLSLGEASMLGITLGLGLMAGTLIGGRLGDRLGQKYVMVAATACACPPILALTNLPLPLATAVLLNLVVASAMGARFVTTNTLLTEQMPEIRGTVLAIAVSIVSVASVVGAIVGGALLDRSGFAMIGLLGAALAFGSMVTSAAFIKEGRVPDLGRT